MTPLEREQLRLSLLGFLNEAKYSMPADFLRQMARSQGRSGLTVDEVKSEMQYLVDKGLAVVDEKLVSPEIKRWRITAAGRDFLAQEIE